MKVRKKVVVPLNTGNRRKIDIRTNYLGVKNLEILSEIFIGFFIDRFFYFFVIVLTGKKVGYTRYFWGIVAAKWGIVTFSGFSDFSRYFT